MMMYLYDNNKDMIFIFLIVVFPFWGCEDISYNKYKNASIYKSINSEI